MDCKTKPKRPKKKGKVLSRLKDIENILVANHLRDNQARRFALRYQQPFNDERRKVVKETIADFMMGRGQGDKSLAERNLVAEAPSGPVSPRLFGVSLVVNPADAEIIDGMVVIRKKVIARDRSEAIERLGVRANPI